MKARVILGGLFLIARCVLALDENHNGLSDVWEAKYPAAAANPNADDDGDGYTNAQEAAFGSDPSNRLSVPKVEQLVRPYPQELPIRISSEKGKQYQLETSSDLIHWTVVGTNYLGTGWPVTIYTRVADAANSAFFRYRPIDVDADNDGLTAWEEARLGSRDDSSDSDGDGLSDVEEFHAGSDPSRADSDGDGISDYDEVHNGTNPNSFNFLTGTTVGLTTGKLSVGNNGAASYSIPISVSPGTAGVQPKLSFEYSSRGGNGMMGVGWSVSGLSAITRAPQTKAQDGAIHGVDFTTADRFAMDGQRLIAINGGVDGVSGTEYRTEIDSFTKVISNGSSGSGPLSFTAYTKSGLIYTFGESDESRFLAQNRSEALSWALSKIADRSGNYILFHYSNNQSTGEYYVSSIEYTKNDAAPLASYASIEFVYETRPDPAIGYIAGSQTSLTQRLTKVRSKYGSQIVREYSFAYEVSPATNKSRLTGIQERAGGLSFNPTTFTWTSDDLSSAQRKLQSDDTYNTVSEEKERWLQGDFTGDGRADILRVTKDNNNVTHLDVVAAKPGSESSSDAFQFSRWKDITDASAFHTEDQWLAGDYDGDGKVDVLRLYQDNDRHCRIQLYSNQAGTFSDARSCAISNDQIPYKTYMLVYPVDLNGDGRLDLLAIFGDGDATGQTGRNVYLAFINQGTNGTQTTFSGTTWGLIGQSQDYIFNPNAEFWNVGDVNGDGLPDLVYIRNVNDTYQLHTYLNRLGSFAPQPAVISTGVASRWDIWKSGDFNGDGLLDLVRLEKSSSTTGVPPATVYLSNGTTFLQQTWSGINPIPDTETSKGEVQVGDYDGDGRSDIGVVTTTPYIDPNPTPPPDPPPCPGCPPNAIVTLPCPTCELNVIVAPNAPTQQITYRESKYMSNGTTAFRSVGNSLESTLPSQRSVDRKRWLQADFNGDGKEDLARVYVWGVGNGQQRVGCDVWSTVAGVHDLLTGVTDGMGSTNSVSYSTLANSSIYSKSTDTLAGAIDLMTPMPVVSSVSYDDGTTTPYSVSYQYNGLKADRLRGLLGFRSVTSTDMRTGIWSLTTLRQDYPFTGMAIASEARQPNGGLLSQSSSTYLDQTSQGGKVHLPYAQQSVAKSYELDGTLVSQTTTTVNSIDSYGNTTNLVVTSLDGWSKTTVSNYDYDSAKIAAWRIGELLNSTVTSSAPGQADVIRKSGFDYTATGEVQDEKIEPDSNTLWSNTDYTPDAFGNNQLATTTGPDIETRSTTTLYESKGRFVQYASNALSQSETRAYDERWGKVNSVTGPNGLTTTTIYDDFGRERLTTRPDLSRTITTYHWASDDSDAPANAKYFVRTEVDGAAPVAVFFDRLGREVRKKTLSGVPATGNPKTIFIDTTYNNRGLVETVSRPYFAGETKYVATTLYDLLARAYQVQTPKEGGGLATTTNVFRGLEVDTINPEQQGTGLKTTSKKDSQGHLIKVTDAKNGTIDYIYDATGNLIEVHQAGIVTSMTYDVRGRKKTMDDPDLGYWTYAYNSLGELISQTDAKGQTVAMTYDKLGRLKSRTEFEGNSTWEYDVAQGKGIGKLYTARFSPADTNLAPYQRTMTYDNLGRPKDETELIEAKNYSVSTIYDSLSRVEFITYPSSIWVRQLYDKNGYLNEVQRYDGFSFWKAKDYDADGHIKQQQLGNGVITDRVYVPETGVLKTIQTGLNAGAGIQNLEYTFSVIGNLSNRTDHAQTVNGTVLKEDFLCDELNRVTSARVAGQAPKTFGYDGSGNILSKDGVGTYSYVPVAGSLQQNERPHPHAVRQVNGGTSATYDPNGNMTSGFDRTLTWTSFNMPKLIQRPSTGASSRFTYEVDHSRITQVASKNGTSTVTTYVGGMYEEVTDYVTKLERKHYISTPAGRIAVYTSTVDLTSQHLGDISYNTKYLHTDHLGSVDVITNEAGAVIERDSFDAWGFRRTTDWTSGDNSIRSIITHGYTGHEMLDDLGLVHMNGRVYDPGLGRFLSADPTIQAPTITQNFNRYSYVLNNPLSLTDPSGFNFLNNFGHWLNHVFGSTGAQIVIGVIAIAAGIATAGIASYAYIALVGYGALAGTGLTGAVVAGAGFGFGSAFISSSLSGASLGQALESAAISGFVGGVGGAVAGQFLHGLPLIERAFGHAVVGGVLSGASNELEGSSFRDGFLGAFLSALASPYIDGLGGANFEGEALRVGASAAVGGTAAELSGGKFANGAVSAAFLRLYNDEATKRVAKKTLVIGIAGAGGPHSGDNAALADLVESVNGTLLRTRSIGGVLDYLDDQQYDRLVIIGYSRGGQSAVNVANALGARGIEVDALITFDPHSGGGALRLIYNNVGVALNFYQKNPTNRSLGIFPMGATNPYQGSSLSSSFISVGGHFYTDPSVSHLNIISNSLADYGPQIYNAVQGH